MEAKHADSKDARHAAEHNPTQDVSNIPHERTGTSTPYYAVHPVGDSLLQILRGTERLSMQYLLLAFASSPTNSESLYLSIRCFLCFPYCPL